MSRAQTTYKLVFVGDTNTGKTAINHKFVTGQFPISNNSTIGVIFTGRQYRSDIKLQFWDTAGQERFRSIVSLYFRNTTGVVMVYDITNRKSFESIVEYWYDQVRQHPHLTIYLLGNKTDLSDQRQVTYTEAQFFAKKHGLNFYEISQIHWAVFWITL